jgi:hypothetical protein
MLYTWNDILYRVDNLELSNNHQTILSQLIDKSVSISNLPERFNDITTIGHNAFRDCTNLALTSLPAGITTIGLMAFDCCTNLALTSLPAGIMSIDSRAFGRCTNLKSLTFKGTPTTISSSAFFDCNNLTTINVPWSEGEVANAPWGATNATINYNYTGE